MGWDFTKGGLGICQRWDGDSVAEFIVTFQCIELPVREIDESHCFP